MSIWNEDLGERFREWRSKRNVDPRKPAAIEDADAILARVRRLDMFRGVAEANIRELLSRMEKMTRSVGDRIVREGQEGDYYYLLLEGKANVLRRKAEGAEPEVVAKLQAGDAFGEEALISKSVRNATVQMETDGVLLRVPKNAFIDYIQSALVTWISRIEAQQKMTEGAKWMDVRDKKQMRKGHLPGAVSMPLSELRARVDELDKDTLYICYCDNGRLSSTAAFLLKQRGFTAAVLQGGLRGMGR